MVWKVDVMGKLHPLPLHQHRLRSPISHCLMLHPSALTQERSDSSRIKGSGSTLDAYTWQNKTAILLAQTISDPICSFCITTDGIVM